MFAYLHDDLVVSPFYNAAFPDWVRTEILVVVKLNFLVLETLPTCPGS
jgi:hypothetical protein